MCIDGAVISNMRDILIILYSVVVSVVTAWLLSCAILLTLYSPEKTDHKYNQSVIRTFLIIFTVVVILLTLAFSA